MIPWNPARTKVQIKLSIQRLRTLQEKKLALAKKARRDIADLLQKGRVETAKLRVEGLIQDDIYVELLELLELYLEMLQARFGLLDAPPLYVDSGDIADGSGSGNSEKPESSIADAVCAIVYAAPRTELKELHVLREILMHKYGRNFALSLQPSDPPPASVPPRILSKLAVYRPPAALVDAYLAEIAKGYGVPYQTAAEIEAEVEAGEGEEKDEGSGSGGEGGVKEAIALAVEGDEKRASTSPSPAPVSAAPRTIVVKKPTEDDDLAARFARLKKVG